MHHAFLTRGTPRPNRAREKKPLGGAFWRSKGLRREERSIGLTARSKIAAGCTTITAVDFLQGQRAAFGALSAHNGIAVCLEAPRCGMRIDLHQADFRDRVPMLIEDPEHLVAMDQQAGHIGHR